MNSNFLTYFPIYYISKTIQLDLGVFYLNLQYWHLSFHHRLSDVRTFKENESREKPGKRESPKRNMGTQAETGYFSSWLITFLTSHGPFTLSCSVVSEVYIFRIVNGYHPILYHISLIDTSNIIIY